MTNLIKKVERYIGKPPMSGRRDSDGDRVVDILDCRPYNKRKQGLGHDIKERYEEERDAFRQARTSRKIIRGEARFEQLEAERKEAKVLARERAKARFRPAKLRAQQGGVIVGAVKLFHQIGQERRVKTYKRKGKKGKRKGSTSLQQRYRAISVI